MDKRKFPKTFYYRIVKSERVSHSVTSDSSQSHDPIPPGSSVHGISPERIPEWVAIPFFRGSSQPRDQTWVSNLSLLHYKQILYHLRHQGSPLVSRSKVLLEHIHVHCYMNCPCCFCNITAEFSSCDRD